MRRVQAVALDLFEARGFADVSVEEVASAAGASAPTIYRHFGTKEQLVLWDEYDPLLFAAIGEAKRGRTLLAAITAAVVRAVEKIYGADGSRILRRTRLIHSEPKLRQANATSLGSMRDGLANALLRSNASRDEMEAEVVAGAVAVALESAVRRWERSDGAQSLSAFIREAMRSLRSLQRTPRPSDSRSRSEQ
jgi:AcrR family transcriptional regulator